MPFEFPERLFPQGKYDIDRMRRFALIISWISIVYNGIEGGVSIGLGIDVAARSLIAFGIQSLVEVLSASLVIYRFRREIQSSSSSNLTLEKRATLGIGILFIVLAVGTWIASIVALITHAEPDSSKPSLIVSTASLICMIFIWLPKPWIAAELNSSVMRGEAACSLACIYLTIVLFIGSLVYKLWSGGWWIDSAIAIILGFFFLHEGWEMISWARHKDFNGGCCKTCSTVPDPFSFSNKTITPADDCENIKIHQCDNNETTCIECDTCVRKPLLSDKTSNSSTCCNSQTKCSTFSTTVVSSSS